MEEQNVQAVIYKMKCTKTNKYYIGQTKTHKKTRGKWYTYGIHCRFSEHITATKHRNTPLCQALKEHGSENFTIKVLEVCSFEDASNRESFYMKKYDSVVPNGYNKQKYSRSYKTKVDVVPTKTDNVCKISGIKKNGVLASAKIHVYSNGEEIQRVNFYRKHETYEQNLERAIAFARQMTNNVIINENAHHSP